MGCVFFKLSLFLTSVVSWTAILTLWTIWTIFYVEAHWLFCWHYYVCAVEVKRRISFNYETTPKPKVSNFVIVELVISGLIVIAFTLNAILVVDYIQSLWYESLILCF